MVKKAQWHLDFNNGFLPVLEAPSGDMVNESGVLMEMASTLAPKGQGLPLWPHEAEAEGDLAANMETGKHRLLMQEFDKYSIMGFYGAYISNFSADEKKEGYKNLFVKGEEFVTKHKGPHGWMHKYENPMMLDISIMTMLERATGLTGGAFNDKVADLNIVETYPEVHAFVKRMQEHKVMGPHLV